MKIAALVGIRVWLRNVAQCETSALLRCHGGLANPLTTTFLVSSGVSRGGDVAELVNNIPYLLCDSLERTHDAQHRLDRRKLPATILSCFELGVAFQSVRPSLKQHSHSKT